MIRLEFERRKKGLTQKELGLKVGINAPEICRIEKCILKPYPTYKNKLSKFFNIPESDLFKEV